VSGTVGLHSVNVFFAGQAIPNSPWGVRIAPVSDARKVRAYGRGLQQSGVRVRDVADFRIATEGAGEGSPEVRVIGPGGVQEPVRLNRIDATNYEAAYTPRKEGRHVVMVTFAGQEIPRSPFEVNVGPHRESKIRAWGPGLTGGVAGYPALFTVDTNGETGALGFSIEGPSEAKIDCHDNGDGKPHFLWRSSSYNKLTWAFLASLLWKYVLRILGKQRYLVNELNISAREKIGFSSGSFHANSPYS